MGNWHISIEGTGAHHNPDYPDDADRMAQRFVGELVAAGHHVTRAAMTYGAAVVFNADRAPGGAAVVHRTDGRATTVVEPATRGDATGLAQRMFEAYGEKAGWLSHDGRPMPQWSEVGEVVQARWQAAADAAIAILTSPV